MAGRLRQGGQGEVLAVTPGATGALGVLLLTAVRADHLPILPILIGRGYGLRGKRG